MNLLTQSDMVAVIPAEVAQRYAAHKLLAMLRYGLRHHLSAYGAITVRDRPLGPMAGRLMGLLAGESA